MENLTNHLEIKHAMERRHGQGAVSKFAKKHGYSLPYVSQTIKGARANETVLTLLANFTGCRVHGVFPSKEISNKKH